MKILILSHMFPLPHDPISGVFVLDQCRALQSLGHQIIVISPIPWVPLGGGSINSKWKLLNQVPAKLEMEGIQVYHPHTLFFPRGFAYHKTGTWYYKAIRSLAKKLHDEEHFEIIHAHTALPDGYAAMMLHRDLKIPHVVTIHGDDLQHRLHQNRYCFSAIGESLAAADKIILVSAKLQRNLRQFYPEIPHTRQIVIGNGIDAKKIPPTPPIFHKKNRTLISLGQLKAIKGHRFVLQAMAKLGEFPLRYVIIGDGEERNPLELLTDELGLRNQVEFTGSLPQDQAMRRMAEADIFVLPSYEEGFGIVYLEAMAMSKPVIACSGQGISDVIESGNNGYLVEPQDINALIHTMRILLSDQNLARSIGSRGKAKVYRSYLWRHQMARLSILYDQVLEMKP